MSKRGRGGASGNKLKMTLGLPVGAVMNCCDNSGARNLYIISVKGIGARLNRLPAAGVGDMVMATVKKGKPELRKKVMPAVVVRQSKPWRRADGVYLYFEDNAGVIVNPKGEMKGSAITGPVGKEAAELWPRIASNSGVVIVFTEHARSMHPTITVTAILFFTIANISTCYLYLYPLIHGCTFPSPSPEGPTQPDESSQTAPFRLLVLGDPQLEGDSSLPNANDAYFPSLQRLSNEVKAVTPSAGARARLAQARPHLIDFVYADTPRLLRLFRKKIDLLGNDFYLAHIYRTLCSFTYPTHVAVLGDLIGSQWVSDGEFERRGQRYWGRVFRKGRRVEDEITTGTSASFLGQNDGWKRRVINVAGNHDIGYAGDVSRERLERFERVFGKVNWETRFTLPASEALDGPKEARQPELRLVVLNSLNMDAPVLYQDAQTDTYKFINDVIAASRPVQDSTSAILLLTHLPLHKETGICVDGPMIKYYDADKGEALKEQNHLTYVASKGILEGIYGMSGNADAPGRGFGRNGIILTGHDHEGCDVYHHLPAADEPSSRSWKAERRNATTSQQHSNIPGLREITVRSMMGDFGGNAGLLSAWYDNNSNKWAFEYSTCALGIQHTWWAVHAFDLVTLLLLSYVGWELSRKPSGNPAASNGKEKTS
ncbi:MAG: hypothetical protein Q9217_004231 [Psora testacea]